jgi:hypothetical protein
MNIFQTKEAKLHEKTQLVLGLYFNNENYFIPDSIEI